MKRDIDRLRALQNDDGGFGFWRRGDESWPYVSIHVAHALARAKAKGFPVPDDTLERSRRYLREIDRHIPSEYGKDVRRTLQAYALSVRALMGDGDPARARALVREAGVEGLSFEALGWVLPVLSKDAASAAEVTAIRRRLANNVAETAERRPLRGLLRRRRAPAAPLRPARRRDPARGAHRGLSRRATSSPSSWRASSPTARPAAGRTRRRTSSFSSPSTATSGPTRRRPPTSWPAPGSAIATRARTRSGAAPPSGSHLAIPMPVPPGRDGHERPPARQGGPGAALLPDRPALRAGQPRPRAARPRVHRRARLRGSRRPEGRPARRRRHLAHPRRRPRARAAHDGRARHGGTTSRSSTRCRPASSRSTPPSP